MKYSDKIPFEGLYNKIYRRVLLSMTGAARQKIEERFNYNQIVLRQNWEGYHLLEFSKTIRPVKQDTKRRIELDDFLANNGIGGFEALQKLPSDKITAFTTKKSEGVFESLAAFLDIPTFVCFLNFLEFCRNSDPYRPLDVFDGNHKLSIEVDGKHIVVTLDYAINDFKKHAKTIEENLERVSFQNSVKLPDSIQPRLTIPQAREHNTNYYANAVLDVVGRDKQKARLEAFLDCDKNVAWFQLAGVAGQGKSRLAFNLTKVAEELGWRAGFLTENDIRFFGDHWNDWQPDKPYLLVFDYVIGREQRIKPILQSLSYSQGKYRFNIRILLVERQRWDQGSEIKTHYQNHKDRFELSMHIGDKAPWFLNLCERDDLEGEHLVSCRFENGVEELKELDQEDLVSIVKQLSVKEITISSDELKQTLERIDDTGRPLYAYLLAQQLSESVEGYRSWTKIDLLNYQLVRDKRRWEQAFEEEGKKAPTWGNSHPAMKLAVLATIVSQVTFEDEKIKSSFGEINVSLGREAIAITSSYLINDDNNPHKIHALEPDLLGEWFVLFCFYKDLKFEELLNLAWEYSPNETAIFLQRITQDFIDLPKTDNDENLIEKLLAQKPTSEDHYQALANVAVVIASELYHRNLAIPHTIIIALEHAAKSKPDAMFFLGYFYQYGIDVTRNPEKAVSLYQQAIEYDNDEALVQLGFCYQDGTGIELDWNKAVDLYRRAVKKGNSTAMASLGFCYQYCIGIEKDKDKAIKLYQRAVKLGNSIAMAYLGHCYQIGEGVKQDWNKAFALYQRAIEKGNALAMIFLGLSYQYGNDIKQDWDKAIDLFQRAVKKGESAGMAHLGRCYQEGEGVEQNWDEAVRLYQQAVELGNSIAMVNLGICYQKGEGIEQNWDEAVRLYQQAVNLGDSTAMVNLGICYQKGEGVKQNWDEAVRLYRQALDLGNSSAMVHLRHCYKLRF